MLASGMDPPDPSDPCRERMVRRQIESRGIRDARVLAAMRQIPREHFVPPDEARFAFDDHPLPIGRGQTISQPYIVALMTEALELESDHRVLEIGAGCGYQSAVLARLCREVCALERDPLLADQAVAKLAALGIDKIDLRCGDGFAGWPEPGPPFDAILTACAAETVPEPLLEQLAAPGRLVIPLGPSGGVQDLLCLIRSADGQTTRHSLGLVRFVPMVPGVAAPI